MLYLLSLVVVITIILFVQKVVMKSRLERGLGRGVKDHELTSLNAWMAAEPNDPNKS
jgi:hypothetical protein